MSLHKLTLADVTISIEIEPESIDLRGNVMASGDADLDAECEREISERLERGDESAWCCLVVTATWVSADGDEYSGVDTLGGCSLSDDYTAAVAAEQHGMQDNALAALNAALVDRVCRCAALAKELAS